MLDENTTWHLWSHSPHLEFIEINYLPYALPYTFHSLERSKLVFYKVICSGEFLFREARDLLEPPCIYHL